jgi:hypothetical protein
MSAHHHLAGTATPATFDDRPSLAQDARDDTVRLEDQTHA